MTTHTHRSRRVWTDDGDVFLRDDGPDGETIRIFRCLGTNVYEIDGKNIRQACENLAPLGYTLISMPDRLEDVIRREYRSACRERAKWRQTA
jgi:hypothetical protein